MRRVVEVLLRVIAYGALLVALVLLWTDGRRTRTDAPTHLSREVLADSSAQSVVRALTQVLIESVGANARRAHAELAVVPSADVQYALRAARVAGMQVTWSDRTDASGLAVAAHALPDPQGGTLVRAFGTPSTTSLVIRDAAGVLDSAPSGSVSVHAARVSRTVLALRRGSQASVVSPALPTLRRVLVLARAGWESKLAMAALEERGWVLDGRLQLSPSTFVTVGVAGTADTSRYAVVFVLDSGVVPRAVLARYLRQGGGVVFAGDALLDESLALLLPARVGALRTGVAGALLTDAPRDGLGLRSLAPIAGAVVLQIDGRARTPAVVARRFGAGRSVVTGYGDSWRWRMEGTDDGADAHRTWWNALATAAAFVPASDADSVPTTVLPGDAAPYADLVAGLGGPAVVTRDLATDTSSRPPLWLLYAIAAIALVAEWGSRRLRGAP